MLSKSDYLLFLKHPAWLWLKTNAKEKLPPPDPGLERIFSRGHDFETYAEALFPDGINLGFSNFNEYETLPERTTKALTDGAKTIFQARFATQNTTCITDILDRVDGNTFDLIEVKSSTKAKPEHIPDLAFQTIVLEQCGFSIRSISVMHVNNSYVRDGKIYPDQLLTRTDVTTEVRAAIPETLLGIDQALRTASLPTIPDISPRYANPGALKDWLEIYLHLNPQIGESSIYHLAGRSIKQIGTLEDMGVTTIENIPEEFTSLTPKQRWQVTATKTNRQHIDEEKIKTFLSHLEFPLYFLDYETLGDLIPAFDGMRPFQQIPFQYSCHVIQNPGDAPRHMSFLHQENTNPGIAFTKQLQKDIGDIGTVLVWNEHFEKSINEIVGHMLPDYAQFYDSLNQRIKDLMTPFAKGWFVDKGFFGSASLKKVQPVLAPDLAYKGLTINHGELAQTIWMDTFLAGNNQETKSQIVDDLLTYCMYDTAVMVKIYDTLTTISATFEKESTSNLE